MSEGVFNGPGVGSGLGDLVSLLGGVEIIYECGG